MLVRGIQNGQALAFTDKKNGIFFIPGIDRRERRAYLIFVVNPTVPESEPVAGTTPPERVNLTLVTFAS